MERPRADGAPCDDGDACTTGDACRAGACVGGAPRVCAEAGPCAEARCEPARGCVSAPLVDGAPCDDGDACTGSDVCRAGVCAGVPRVCSGEGLGPCERAACAPDGSCGVVDAEDGTPCDDGVACDGRDACRAGRCIAGAGGCGEGPCFTDVTVGSGLEALFLGGDIGGGAALLDADGDGALDLVVAGELDVLRLFLGRGDGTFRDATAGSGLVGRRTDGSDPASPAIPGSDARPMGLAVGDLDEDGRDDLIVLRDGRDQVYLGRGDGTFEDVSARSGLDPTPRWSTGAALADVDGDGHLDLYVVAYIEELDFPDHGPAPNAFYRGRGDGSFERVPDAALEGAGTSLAALFADADDDGDPDLFVCNDFGANIEPNRFFENRGGALVERSAASRTDLAFFCMGMVPGDYDRDGDLDVFVPNLGPNALLRRVGDRYEEVAARAGLEGLPTACTAGRPTTSWGGAFLDVDLDGWLDLWSPSGFVGYGMSSPEDPDRLFLHQGPALTFAPVYDGGVGSPEASRGGVAGDLDRDGDVDLVQVNVRGGLQLLRNDTPRRGRWLGVRLPGHRAVGARVALELPGGDTLVRWLHRQAGYASSQPGELHFGLGEVERVERLHVRWRDGSEVERLDVEPDQWVELRGAE
ncbi:MAG TPA: CRTAC1 family protein [Polyangiaceae bacterium LLY-WYZ-15_(1-7)]|nr:CRTAC1 family protein [Polyangiaceae bacterium LLY-WYZ-15_(1-7)]HJL07417.1 CRTAC1 family protein [Polyangiaceae bacterium LLY-WYZ-15_(1-7)]HJL39071.1 CRTAC1 family protein [Polyangiaceae bacterium LLY-WYZ-15_(1-7)]